MEPNIKVPAGEAVGFFLYLQVNPFVLNFYC